jgi:hypothetical protein
MNVACCRALVAAGCVCLPLTAAVAQDADPFAGNYLLSNSAEIVLAHTRMPHFISGTQQQVPDHLRRIFDVTGFGVSNLPNEVVAGALDVEANTAGGPRGHDLVVGDFDGDDFDEAAIAWEGNNGDLTLLVSDVSPTTLEWSPTPQSLTFTGALNNSTCGSTSKMRLVAANLDTDGELELVLAYWAGDGTITIRVYDVASDLSLAQRATINNAPLSEIGLDCDSRRFDIAAGDFNGDGRREIMLARVLASSFSEDGWALGLDVYELTDGTPALQARASTAIGYDNPFESNPMTLRRMAIAAGDMTGDLVDEVVVAYVVQNGDSPSYTEYYAFSIAQDLTAINADNIVTSNPPGGWLRTDQSTGGAYASLAALIKDINQDGRGELFIAMRNGVEILDANDALALNEITTVGRSTLTNSDHLRPFAVDDLNAETAVGSAKTAETDINSEDNAVWRYELVSVSETEFQADSGDDYNEMEISVYELRSIPGTVQAQLLAEVAEDRITGRSDVQRRIAIALGDFDRDSVRLGKPRRSRRTDIVRPLVVLNAPPTHFDLLNEPNCPGGACDVNQCFGGGACNFVATHERITQRTIDVTTQVNADWTVSNELKAGLDVEIEGVGIKAQERLKATVGERFSKTNRYTSTLTIQDRQTAIVDDFIYALVADYDLWEYPVYADGEIQGWILAVVPGVTQNRWFDSKSYSAVTHLPAHEVGNILSYQSLSNPSDNNTFAEGVRFQTGDGRTLGGFASSNWSLTDENAQETTTEREVSNGVEGTPNGLALSEEVFGLEAPFLSEDIPILVRSPTFDLVGNGAEVTGRDDTSELFIAKSTVRDERGLFVDFGPIDLALGNVRYTVTPYVYWAKNGALVLDYAVEPEIAPIGQPDTFWDVHYGSTQSSPGRADPAFILPWRYDPEKGFPLSEPAQREQTKDITFVPVDPEPGDVVTIIARVHNWSLIPTDGPVAVRFYNGDPAAGGTLLVSPSGDSEVLTTDRFGLPEAIPPRGSAFARMDWTLPNENTSFYRIYALLDPNNAQTEIHETNNVGWNVLTPIGDPLPLSPLAASVLPTSRSATVGAPVTAFATLINTDPSTATGCSITPRTVLPGTFSYQTTDPGTNGLTGTPDTPVNVPSGGLQTFVIAYTPATAFAPADVQLNFDCENTVGVVPISGVNTMLLSASTTPVPDVVALGATPTGDGILRIAGPSSSGAFATATVNVGAAGTITVRADTAGTALPLTLNVCQTDPGSGTCINPTAPAATATVTVATNETHTFTIFATAGGDIPLDASRNRILVRFRDGNNVVRGATSVAVTTQ